MDSLSSSSQPMPSVISTDTTPSEHPTQTTQQITQFIDDTAIQTATLPSPADVTRDILASGSEQRVHEITDVLQRPVEIVTFEWADTVPFDNLLPINPTGTDTTTLNFPSSLFQASPNLVDKVNHFSFLRAKLVIRILVNSNPFQLGKLIAYFSPYSAYDDIGDRTSVNGYMTARSAFPHVLLDAGSGNSGELCIPFVSYYTHWNLPLDLGNLGNLQVAVLNSLKSGTCNVTIFARFEDVHLEIPTAKPNSLLSTLNLEASLSRFITRYGKRGVRDALKRLPVAQVDEGRAKDSSGTISSVLGSVSGIASMASSLPVIGKYLLPVSWVAGAASKIAQYAGFSKPLNLTQQHRLTQLPAYGFTHGDGSDTSLSLSNSCENSIGSRFDVFGTSSDDMEIAYLAAHSTYVTTFEWSQNDLSGKVIGDINVTPGCVSTFGEAYNSTLLSYVASMFRYWRGGIKFKFQVAKTAYHSGRLRFTFIPSGRVGETTGYRLDQAYSEILDLRVSNELEMSVDYVSNTLWKDVSLCKYDEDMSTDVVTGIIRIEVLNKLVLPSTVNPSVYVNVWVGGGDDIAFACPEFNRYFPVTPDAPSAVTLRRRPKAQVYDHMQSSSFDASLRPSPEMFSSVKASQLDCEINSVGEHVSSLRQLTRRFGRISTISVSDDSTYEIGSAWFGDLPSVSSGNASLLPMCPLWYISWLYRFHRGSVRYKCVDVQGASGLISAITSAAQSISPLPPNVSSVSPANRNLELLGGSAFSHFVDTRYNNVCEIAVPYYNNTHVSLLRGDGAVTNQFMEKQTHVYFSVPPGEFRVLAAAGDDFSFGWIVGPPRLAKREAVDALTATVDYGLTDSATIIDTTSGELTLAPVSVSAGTYTLIGQPQTFEVIHYTSTFTEVLVLDFPPNVSLSAISSPFSGYQANTNFATTLGDGTYDILLPAATTLSYALTTGEIKTVRLIECALVSSGGIGKFVFPTVPNVDVAATEALLADAAVIAVTVGNPIAGRNATMATIPDSFTVEVANSMATIPFSVTIPSDHILYITETVSNAQALGVVSYGVTV